jgi:hypothetical protein
MGKLILLQRVREDAEREALARAARAEERAAAAERAAEERVRGATEVVARAEREPVPERGPAEVLELQGRWARSARRAAAETREALEARRGERIGAEEAFARLRPVWERTRRARERFEAKQAQLGRAARRARERREEEARDDLPPRAGEGEDGRG